jgi:two-component system sensor histidine kinase DctS
VEDNGPGIVESKRPHLFDAFFTTKPGGMGMGLAISKSIVEAHEGILRFEPREDIGARFLVELPAA